ncbi:MAG: dihydrolipoamide acetyltransferase family protein [Flavobacteriales bacterium]|jgi:pyruvate dehydrogenase E2 component (dihydrolipoamide acetyltransferase)|nr:dihydrolipoamide acetyltransferase family protein [Flavobacteriales bacterium]
MAEIVLMPKLSDTMTEGVVAEWHKKVGDKVESGDLLAEIESDKATMEFESFQEGVLLHIGIEAGATAPVDSILAILGDEGEDVTAILEEAKKKPAESDKIEATPKADAPVAPKTPVAPTPIPAPVESSAPKTASSAPAVLNDGKIVASPLARKLAEEKNIPLSQVPGSGDGGRIVKRDIENFIPGGVVNTSESFYEEGLNSMRKVIGQRLSESKFSAPHFYLTQSIDMDNAMVARKAIIEAKGTKVSFNDMVLKATAKALKKHPGVNCSFLGDRVRYNDHVHIGVAMAVENGLLVPVVRFADQKSLQDISAEVKDYSVRAKDNKLTPDDWAGSTFTVSNLGMFGIESFTSIINSPDAAIMAIGGIKQVPVVKNNEIVPGNIMKVTLSCDHRAVDGAVGAAFLLTFKQILENPVLMYEL